MYKIKYNVCRHAREASVFCTVDGCPWNVSERLEKLGSLEKFIEIGEIEEIEEIREIRGIRRLSDGATRRNIPLTHGESREAGGCEMIYTVTFNPSLDYIVDVDDFRLGLTNRTSSELMLPGGKGLNVSMVLGNLGIENTALGFVAGFTGREIMRRVEEMGVKADFLFVEKGFSRINVKLKSVDGTEINGCGPMIEEAAVQKLMDKLDMLGQGDMLVLAGSIPGSMPDDMYGRILERLAGRGVMTAVDAAGGLLLNVLKYRPFLVKPNIHELGEIFGAAPRNGEQALPYALKLSEMGAVNVLVSMGGEGALLAAGDGRVYTAPAPKGRLVNAVGAGDSMVAGFLAGWMERGDYGHAFRMGLSAGSASAFSELLATGEEIRALYERLCP